MGNVEKETKDNTTKYGSIQSQVVSSVHCEKPKVLEDLSCDKLRARLRTVGKKKSAEISRSSCIYDIKRIRFHGTREKQTRTFLV